MKTALVILLVLIVSAVCVFLLRKRTTTYWNPIDSKGYSAEWQTYQPQGRHGGDPARRTLSHIRLLNEQRLYEGEVGIQRLAEFCKAIEAVVNRLGNKGASKYQLLIEVTVSPKKPPSFQMATQDEAQQDGLQAIYDELVKLDDLRSREAELRFQMQFELSGLD